jgi:hypothetical protein
MNGIISDPAFNKSPRCVALLQRLVTHALNGNHERLKERTLGIEVFGRPMNYSPGADSVVRMAANEVQKRLAQYYHGSNQNHRVIIRLVPGSYLPEFEFQEAEQAEEAEETRIPEAAAELQLPKPRNSLKFG